MARPRQPVEDKTGSIPPDLPPPAGDAGYEPWSEAVWLHIEEILGVSGGPDAALRGRVRAAILNYITAHAPVMRPRPGTLPTLAREPELRWRHVRDSLRKIEHAAKTLAACVASLSNEDPVRERYERERVRTMLTTFASSWRPDPKSVPLGDGNIYMAQLDDVLARLPAIAAAAHGRAVEETKLAPRGEKPDDSLPHLVARLAEIYEARTGREPDVVCDRRGNGDYSGGFYYFVRMVAANLPRSSGSLIKRSRGRLALGQELTRLLTGASKGGRRSTHVRRKPDRTYEVICTQPAPPSLLRLFARE